MMTSSMLRTVWMVVACLTFLVGVLGMAVSFLLLLVVGGVEILACAAGFVAGSILAAGGLVSTSILLARPAEGGEKPRGPSDFH